MSAMNWLRVESAKCFTVLQVLVFLDFQARAQRTGRSYNAVAEARTDQFAEAVAEGAVAIVGALPPRVGVLVVSLPVVAVFAYKLHRLAGIVEGMVYRHGVLRTVIAGGLFVIGLLAWIEHANELPPWARPMPAGAGGVGS